MTIERLVDPTCDSADSGWAAVVPTTDSKTLPPDPHFMDAIGGNHRLETAIADLVDNALDAGAANILIRFVVGKNRVESLYVVDDGSGMTETGIDAAMTVGSSRDYSSTDLGHFGLGLKAASFSQADSLTVVSRSRGRAAVGRRWLTRKASNSFECDIVPEEFCERELGRPWGSVKSDVGTIVRWDAIRVFPSGDDVTLTTRFVQDASQRLRQHLGLVFHRFLQRDQVTIGIDVEDAEGGGTGPVVGVTAIDPFGYLRPGAGGYPKELTSTVAGTTLPMVCHIWPARSTLPQFRLYGQPGEASQGLYFYRHDRLLQAGGWNNLDIARKDLQLARVAVDLDDALVALSVLRMNPEKSRVETGHVFSEAVNGASASDGTGFHSYLDTARETFKTATKRSRARAPVVPLGRGVPASVRRSVNEELTSLAGYDDVDLRWRRFTDDVFFDIDREENTIWLNVMYRHALTGGGRAALNDAALVKTLLFLLVENLFHGSWWGPKDKDNLELWQSLLTTAAREALV